MSDPRIIGLSREEVKITRILSHPESTLGYLTSKDSSRVQDDGHRKVLRTKIIVHRSFSTRGDSASVNKKMTQGTWTVVVRSSINYFQTVY